MAEIALRRRGPDSLPDSGFLVVALLTVYVLVSLFVTVALVGGISLLVVARLAVDTALVLAFVFAGLSFFRLERRYRQTVSAMLGADIVISLAFLPVGFVGIALGFNVLEEPFIYISLAFRLWSIFIAASILARSLSQPLIVGFMLEILLVLTSINVGQLMTPPAEQVSAEAV
jgi:hypothetical protein